LLGAVHERLTIESAIVGVLRVGVSGMVTGIADNVLDGEMLSPTPLVENILKLYV